MKGVVLFRDCGPLYFIVLGGPLLAAVSGLEARERGEPGLMFQRVWSSSGRPQLADEDVTVNWRGKESSLKLS